MASENLKQDIVQYTRDFYSRNREPPSVRQIIHKCGISFSRFYKLFPGGLSEACRLAGVPVPMQRINKTKRALETSKGRKEAGRHSVSSTGRLTLTEEQTGRIYGIVQLEGGKDPVLIVDDMLDLDYKARKRKLSLAKRKKVSEFLEVALERGWKVNTAPDIIASLTKAHNLGLLTYSPETLRYFISVLEWARKSKWSPFDFVNYVTQSKNLLMLYMMAKQNRISRQEFERRASQYV